MPADKVRDDIRTFLTSRRARLTPQQAGLPDYGGQRRVTGLRRSEVAQLAAISMEYYARLERGNVRGVSDEILQSICAALRLDEVECAHLARLVHAANSSGPGGSTGHGADAPVRPSVQQVLDAMTGAVAFARNGRLDILATNRLARVLYHDALEDPETPANLARFVFRDPRARVFYRDWEHIAHAAAGSLRAEAARNPADTDLADLIDELAMHSEEFARRWEAHDLDYYRSGQQHFHHRGVGDLDLDYDALEVPADPGLTIVTYTVAATAPHAGAFACLARLANPQQGGRERRLEESA